MTASRSSYYRRIFQAYLGRGNSQLSFWHETPAVNEAAFRLGSRAYYMTFADKARYAGPFDDRGVPMLDYRGSIGPQFNPIAIAQYGLAAWNQEEVGVGCRVSGVSGKTAQVSCAAGIGTHPPGNPTIPKQSSNFAANDSPWRSRVLAAADWLVDNLKPNAQGIPVWPHLFDWEYFQTLKAPWYSGLAQGQGISLLVRAHEATGDIRYRDAAERAFQSLVTPMDKGGTLFVDDRGDWWIEEYITIPPTHILNGMMWALWGVRDLVEGFRFQVSGVRGEAGGQGAEGMAQSGGEGEAGCATLNETGTKYEERGTRDNSTTRQPSHPATDNFCGREAAAELWEKSLATLERNLPRFDDGAWSLYDLAPVGMRNVASAFYHRLHVVQLDVMWRLTGREVFREFRDRWAGYQASGWKRRRALVRKAVFKLAHY